MDFSSVRIFSWTFPQSEFLHAGHLLIILSWTLPQTRRQRGIERIPSLGLGQVVIRLLADLHRHHNRVEV